MATNINLNLNQSPYFDDYDEDKDFHQVLYKPAVAVQARELTQEQTILRNQLKRFGDHIFANGSRVIDGSLHIDTDYDYVKLQATYNNVAITPANMQGKLIIGSQSGTTARVVNSSVVDATTGNPDTIWVKYLTGGGVTQKVQGITVTNAGTGYTSIPTVTITGGGGSGATAVAVVGVGGATAQTIIGIDVTAKGSGYTTTPSVTITGGGGADATCTATVNTSAVFNAGERIVASDFSSAVFAASSSATGKGAAVSNDAGYYYFNGNFIRVASSTVLLDNYTNTPSYRIGFQVNATVVDSGDDTSLLDNAQGAYNYAAPGADRLKYTLTLEKKTTASTDDIDFIEITRLVNGVKHSDNPYPIYSVLEETFARRTFDESGSYTVRHFPIQRKIHSSDASKWTARLDPGKAYIYGHEFETLISSDVTVDRARDYKNVNNFDRLMQYGNYAIVSGLTGLYNVTTHAIIDLHNVAHASISLLSPTNYTNSKVGTARVRQLTQTIYNGPHKMYLYDITMSSGDFGDVDSITIPSATNLTTSTVASATITAPGSGYSSVPTVAFSGGGGTGAAGTAVLTSNAVTSITITSAGSGYTSIPTIAFSGGGGTGAAATAVLTPVVINSKTNIDNTGKVGGIGGGDAKLFETDFNSLVFKLPQDTIKTIRDDANAIDTSYTIQRTFASVSISSGTCTLTSGGSNETFYGTGLLSGSVVGQHYHAQDAAGTIVNLNTSSPAQATVTVAGNGQSVTIFTGDSSLSATFNFIVTMNMDTKQERIKTLVMNKTLAIASPSSTALGYTSLALADATLIKAVYDSGATGTDAVAPTLTVTGATGTFIAGETITGGTSGAKGTVIAHTPLTVITFVVTSGTFAGTETISGTTYSATMAGLAVGDTDIKANYTLDTGQRDNFYDHGRIQLTGTAPTGRILVIFCYFTHAGIGYLSVDSYTAAVGYDDVSAFTSPTSGKSVELRDCIDFRPRRDDGATTLSGAELPYPNLNWQADYSYYMPRIDVIYLSKEKTFGVQQGVSSDNPVPPFRLDNTMSLYQLIIPAYTFTPSDIVATYLENKRYTMKDIGKLERRLNNVEYYTALTLLEKDAEALVIKDTAGLDRFKNGIMVDDFAGHGVGDVTSADYKCSIDFKARELRSPFSSNIVDLSYISGSSTGVQKTGDLISLPYTTTAFVTQTHASTFLNVNPFNVTAWVGVLNLDPPNDNWVADNNRPDVIVNATGENDAWAALTGFGFGSEWNDWQNIGMGTTERLVETGPRFDPLNRGGQGAPRRPWMERQTFAVDQLQSRTGVRTEITGSEAIESSLGERVVNVSVLPFIRARNITVNVTGMKPNTRVYPFFDKEAVTTYCTPSGGSAGGAIYTDDSGSVSGLVFAIPCPVAALEQDPPLLIFRTGERQFLLTDDPNGNLETASTYADRMYQAQGLLQTKENVILSTRVPRIERGGAGSATEARTTSRLNTRNVATGAWIDPLAQTFLVDETIYPDGIYLSSTDLYFKTKDDGNIPVSMHIRDVEQGFPTNRIVPFSDVSLNPASVNVSETAATSTPCVFTEPVYLMPGEYAIIITSNSLKYECWVAEMGQNIIGTTRKVSEQPYAGVLFKSQNASTWQQNQNQDLTFKLNRCSFTIAGTHEAVFHNSNSADYKMDTMNLTPAEIIVNKTNIGWGIKTTDQSTSQLTSAYDGTVAKENHAFDNQQIINTTPGSFIAKATLTSTSEHITPYIDTKRLSVIPVENKINNLTTDETEQPSGGSALAKYITRRVTLSDGFDATDIKTYLTMNKPAGTNVYVYYKVLSQYDPDPFDDKSWIVMTQSSKLNTVALDEDDFIDYEFNPLGTNVNYTSGGATYTSFKTFAMKIVMTSISTSKVPRVGDMRTIALA